MRSLCTLLQVCVSPSFHFSRGVLIVIVAALAAVTFLRSLAGFGFPLFAPAMYNALGYGKGDTILACFAIAVGVPAYVSSSPRVRSECGSAHSRVVACRPFLLWKYG